MSHFDPSLSSISPDLTHVRSTEDRGTAKSLSRVFSESPSLLSSSTSLATRFIKRDSGSTQAFTLGKETFASVSLDHELLMLVPKLVPQSMEFPMVWAMNNMAEPGVG